LDILWQTTVYPYPAVQYIPLSLQVLYHKEPINTDPFMLIGDEFFANLDKLTYNFALDLPTLTGNNKKMLIFTSGLHLFKAKYRGYYVTITGVKHASISLYQIPAYYFYKDKVVFEVKDEEGKVLQSKTIPIDLKKRK